VHLSLTKSVSGKLPLLEARLSQALAARQQQQQQREAAGQPGAPPEPQLLAMAVVGRVLAAEHVAAGRYLPAEDVAGAQALLLRGAAGAELPLLGPEAAGGWAASGEAALQALQGLLAEVWADADVAAAFQPGALGAPDQLPSIGEVRARLLGGGCRKAAAAAAPGAGERDAWRGGDSAAAAGALLGSLDFQQAAQEAVEQVLAGAIQEELGQLL
jgi:hypothetical protein